MIVPYIVFLDLDKTVIGRAHASVERFFLHKVIRELADAGELDDGKVVPIDSASEMGLVLRPGFGASVRRIERALEHVEFFVCTMGVPSTVTDLKVPGIERAAGIRINRPIFHRALCQSAASESLKLVGQCFKLAAAALAKRKYPALRDPTVVISERFFMVDDTPNVAFDDASNAHLLVCPPYEYQPQTDPFEGIPASVLSSPKVARYIADRKLTRGRGRKTPDPDGFWPALAAQIERTKSGEDRRG